MTVETTEIAAGQTAPGTWVRVRFQTSEPLLLLIAAEDSMSHPADHRSGLVLTLSDIAPMARAMVEALELVELAQAIVREDNTVELPIADSKNAAGDDLAPCESVTAKARRSPAAVTPESRRRHCRTSGRA